MFGLVYVVDTLKDQNLSDAEAVSGFSEQTRKIFDRPGVLSEVEQLLAAHTSDQLFRPTDYHFLILYDVILIAVDIHNDGIRTGLESLFPNLEIGIIDLDVLLDIYLWDTDFLLPAETLNKLTAEGKNMLGFSKELFGVVQGLRPHPDELELKPMEIPEGWVVQDIYRPGKEYPFTDG